MTRICFIDTETTSLRPDRRAWEIGLIVRSEDGTLDTEHHWFIDVRDLDLGNADVMSLKIGRFYDRHPQAATPHLSAPDMRREDDAMRHIERLTRGAHLVGAVPNFDADVLGQRMRANGICPSWHYHLIDWKRSPSATSTADAPARTRSLTATRWRTAASRLRVLSAGTARDRGTCRSRGSPMTCPPRSASRSATRTGTPPSVTPGGLAPSTTR